MEFEKVFFKVQIAPYVTPSGESCVFHELVFQIYQHYFLLKQTTYVPFSTLVSKITTGLVKSYLFV